MAGHQTPCPNFIRPPLYGPMSVEVLSGVVALTIYATSGTLLTLCFIGCTHKGPKRSHLYKSRDPTIESVSVVRQQARSSTTQQSSNTDEGSKPNKYNKSRFFFTSPDAKIQESSRIAAESSRPSSAEIIKQPAKQQKTDKRKRRSDPNKTTTSVNSNVGFPTTTKQSASAEKTSAASAEKTKPSAEKTANPILIPPDASPSMKAIVDWEIKMRQDFPELTEPTQRVSTASVKQNTLAMSSGEAVDVLTPPLSLHEDENGMKYLSSHSSNDLGSEQPVKPDQKNSVYVITAQPGARKQ